MFSFYVDLKPLLLLCYLGGFILNVLTFILFYFIFAFQASESKREQFRRYLEKSGVLDTLTSGEWTESSDSCWCDSFRNNNIPFNIFWYQLLQVNESKSNYFVSCWSCIIFCLTCWIWTCRLNRGGQQPSVRFEHGVRSLVLFWWRPQTIRGFHTCIVTWSQLQHCIHLIIKTLYYLSLITQSSVTPEKPQIITNQFPGCCMQLILEDILIQLFIHGRSL